MDTQTIIVFTSYKYCFLAAGKSLLLTIAIIGFSLFFQYPIISLAGIPLTIVGFSRFALLRIKTYQITPQQVICSGGIFNKSQTFYELYGIKDFVVNRSFVEQLLRLMTVT